MAKQIFDPIHGFISTTPLMQQIIDTKEFQRLRDLKQLGAVSFVFPSANHTRFEHSLGVSHLAGIMASSLREKHPGKQISDRDIELIRIAGLIHDIGHGPYSHLYDHYVRQGGEPEHEERGCIIFKQLVQDHDLELSEEEVEDIIQMVHPSKERMHHWKYQIVANRISHVDVDKIDYLQRDSYHIGLKIDGEYSRLLTQCYIKEYSNDAADHPPHEVIAWPEKLQFDMFALFLTRYRLHKQVYNHHTVKAFEYVIAEILQKLKEKNIPFIECSDSMVLCHLHADLRGVQDKLKQRKLPKLIAEKIIQSDTRERILQVSADTYPRYVLDLIIDKVEIGFASSKHSNPLDQIYYFKDVHDPECFRLKASTTSFCIPEKHYETILRLYTTNPHRPTDPEVINNFLYKL